MNTCPPSISFPARWRASSKMPDSTLYQCDVNPHNTESTQNSSNSIPSIHTKTTTSTKTSTKINIQKQPHPRWSSLLLKWCRTKSQTMRKLLFSWFRPSCQQQQQRRRRRHPWKRRTQDIRVGTGITNRGCSHNHSIAKTGFPLLNMHKSSHTHTNTHHLI